MVPTLGISQEKRLQNGFINAYVKDKDKDDYGDDYIHLLFQPDDYDVFQRFLDDEYERSQQLIEDYDYEGGFTVMIYRLSSKWDKDFKLVREGKYSLTSREFQDVFPKVAKIIIHGKHNDEISLQYRIFKKTTDMKIYWEEKLGISFNDSMEVWDKFEYDKEVLDIKEIKQRLQEINAHEKTN